MRSRRLEADLLLDVVQDSLYPSVPDPVGRVEHDLFHRLNDPVSHFGLKLNQLAARGGADGRAGAGDYLEEEIAWSRDGDRVTFQ